MDISDRAFFCRGDSPLGTLGCFQIDSFTHSTGRTSARALHLFQVPENCYWFLYPNSQKIGMTTAQHTRNMTDFIIKYALMRARISANRLRECEFNVQSLNIVCELKYRNRTHLTPPQCSSSHYHCSAAIYYTNLEPRRHLPK